MIMNNEQWNARKVLAKHSRSFSMAGTLLSREALNEAAALYAWCRRADDSIDGCQPGEATSRLRELQRELDSVYAGDKQEQAVLAGFQALITRHQIPQQYPQELLNGFATDADTVRLQTEEELLVYCYRVAGVVGLMMCPLLGVNDARALRHASHLGIAMQLTNIARDVAEDWQRQRLYLPESILATSGYANLGLHLGGPIPPLAKEPLTYAVRSVLVLATRYYESGNCGLGYLPARSALAIRTASKIYSAIGTELERNGHDPLRGRVVVSTFSKLRLIVKALFEELIARLSPSRVLTSPADAAPRALLPAQQDSLHGTSLIY